jgi:hypothetical protein
MKAGDASTQERNVRLMRDWHGHQKMATVKKSGGGKHSVLIPFSINSNVKPKMPKEVPENMLPIWARQLTARASHLKKRLTGMVIEDAIFTGSIYFVVRDTVGNLVKIGVYYIPNALSDVAAQLFQCGKCMTIVEPYLKIGMDGNSFMHVNNPETDVLRDSQLLPGCNAAAWQLEGKQFFVAHMAAAAFECWSRALSFAAASTPVSTLLTNQAAALLQSEQPARAVYDCFVALTINPLQIKAAGRLVDGLSALGLQDVARTYAHSFAEWWQDLK